MPTCEAFLRDSSIFEVDNIKTAAIPRDVNIFQLGNIKKVPRMPRKTKVDVTKCHTCHAKVKVCVSKLCVRELCVSELCVNKL